VLPARGDHPFVAWSGRSFYGELLDAGIRVFEFERGALHSKIMTVDHRWAMIGSANMDIRSFRLNYEVTALIFDEPLAREISRSIESFTTRSRVIHHRQLARRGMGYELMEGVARLFAPLL
jgi:cardiolipin synthase A/B